MRCPKCQKEIGDDIKFCPKCGEPLAAATPERQVIIKEKAPDKSITILIVLLCLLVCLLVVLAIHFLSPPKDSAETSGNDAPDIVVHQPAPAKPDDDPVIEEPAEEDFYLFPSDHVYITESDLYGKSKEEVSMIRNEIYARHGYIFKTEPYKTYFESQPWYVPNESFDESLFNHIEKANKEFLVLYEESRGWR